MARHDNVCRICGDPGELICCTGSCLGSFHVSCIGLNDVPQGVGLRQGTARAPVSRLSLPSLPDIPCVTDRSTAEGFKCDECTTGNYLCNACEQPGEHIRCDFTGCGRRYHADCARRLPNAS